MLSYQHAYHAGNGADLHKHGILAALLALLAEKPRGLSYLESHAGRGLYDLGSAEALRTGEAARGIRRIVPEGAYSFGIALGVQRYGNEAYPGSPLLAALLLRPQDRIVLCELHPAEHAALRATLVGDPRVAIHRRDGHEGLRALTPPSPRRGLALIDPSYELKDEYARSAETALGVLARWPQGIVLVWYPVLPAGRHRTLVGRLAAAAGPALTLSEVAFTDPPARGMQGSGLAILNAPHGTPRLIEAALAPFACVLRPVPSAPRQ